MVTLHPLDNKMKNKKILHCGNKEIIIVILTITYHYVWFHFSVALEFERANYHHTTNNIVIPTL